MDMLDTFFANTAHIINNITPKTESPSETRDEDELEDAIHSDDDMKIDLSSIISTSAFNSFSTAIYNMSNGGSGRFPASTSTSTLSASQLGCTGTGGGPIRKIPGTRPERGKFTILDDDNVATPEEVLDVEFTIEYLQKIFSDPKLGIQFLARYGLIPNTRVCRVENCPKDQLMSLIKHANGFVWRCRSCRKRREKRIITKISVYEGTFLFYSRMPLNKFFIFMLVWCENPGLSITEYNKLMGENRLVEETIYNTIGFMRDIIQNWCETIMASDSPIGGTGKHVEIIETMCTEHLSNKSRNRRTRHYISRTVFVCLEDNTLAYVDYTLTNRDHLERAVKEKVAPGSTVIMKDTYLEKFGDLELLDEILRTEYIVSSIADAWPDFDSEERERQYLKTEMNNVPNAAQEPYAYEYFFRRCFREKCFNHLLRVIRLLYAK
ncbi:unnamed protein product [Caenorhabditis bovis]|uniref:ISXO2-like transposase domain-containing protein n=1 Tax=Caenorhabditis bovis TaxID=2654633 RepID=A0A8S1F827_9PELO|nr:unnamed protein product [Caenorhabditis bovis]